MDKVKYLIFDLDDTLYSAQCGIDEKFIDKIIDIFKEKGHDALDKTNFFQQMKELKEKHGSEVAAAQHLGLDPDEFMEKVCDVDVSEIPYNPLLKEQLNNLPNKKFIYTNSTHKHVQDVLKRLELEDMFDGVFTAVDCKYIVKPHVESFKSFLNKYDINAQDCIMFEDSHKNLATAKDLGMKTVYISDCDGYSYCDYTFDNINEALKIL